MITQVPGLLPAWLKAQNQKWLMGGRQETGAGGWSATPSDSITDNSLDRLPQDHIGGDEQPTARPGEASMAKGERSTALPYLAAFGGAAALAIYLLRDVKLT
tara:strand:+ start:215 stop:520 length:306 start_codon:yes stop_codon:yes gene_type:complete